VTAAKYLVSGMVGIDMLAGPSELVVAADDTVSPDLIAADLLAQAEHDPDARPILVTTHRAVIDAVNRALVEQLATLETSAIAQAALRNGYAVLCEDVSEVAATIDRLAPEHLELLGPSIEPLASVITHYGGLFVGSGSAEVLGDYGAGPNHVLPTGGTARNTGGLSVFTFLRVRTWMRIDSLAEAQTLVADTEQLANLEGLVGHARSAAVRRR